MRKLAVLDDLAGADEETRAKRKSLVGKVSSTLDEIDRLLKEVHQELEKKKNEGTWDPITNDRISQLQGPATKFINQAESELEIKLRVTQGLRTFAEQDDLYAKGRTAPGKIVTNAKGGQSYHNYGLAVDVVEIRNGQAIWDKNWSTISKIGIRNGFEWGGNFKSIPDNPHFQMTLGYSIPELLNLHNAGKWQ